MVNLGDEVKDKVTGFKGIAVARHQYLQGCARISVQPTKLDKEGKKLGVETFDAPQLIVVKVQKVQTGERKTGGPAYLIPPERRQP